MKRYSCLLTYLCLCVKCFSQDSSEFKKIDSIVAANRIKEVILFQKIKPGHIEVLDGKTSKYFYYSYKITPNNMLLSATYIAYSIGDTSLIINYYFLSNQLIKVNVVNIDMDNHHSEDTFYYSNNHLLNKVSLTNGPYMPNYYLDKSVKLIKKLKRDPSRFRNDILIERQPT